MQSGTPLLDEAPATPGCLPHADRCAQPHGGSPPEATPPSGAPVRPNPAPRRPSRSGTNSATPGQILGFVDQEFGIREDGIPGLHERQTGIPPRAFRHGHRDERVLPKIKPILGRFSYPRLPSACREEVDPVATNLDANLGTPLWHQEVLERFGNREVEAAE
jgi:hypothetical protein